MKGGRRAGADGIRVVTVGRHGVGRARMRVLRVLLLSRDGGVVVGTGVWGAAHLWGSTRRGTRRWSVDTRRIEGNHRRFLNAVEHHYEGIEYLVMLVETALCSFQQLLSGHGLLYVSEDQASHVLQLVLLHVILSAFQ